MSDEGWGKSAYSKKWHYFVDRIPLCNGATMLEGRVEQGNDDSDDNCIRCMNLLKQRRGLRHDKDQKRAQRQGDED